MITSILNAKNLVKRVKRKINLKNTLRSDESLDSKWTFLGRSSLTILWKLNV